MTGTVAPSDVLAQALACCQAGRFPDAERLYRAHLDAQPWHPEANCNLAELLARKGELEAALSHFRAALESDSSQARSWLGYIDALLRTGQDDDAVRALVSGRLRGLSGPEVDALTVRAYAAAPENEPLASGLTLYMSGRLAEAEEHYRKALALNPRHASAHGGLGGVLLDLGRQEEAEASCRRALEIQPDCALTHVNLGIALCNLGRLEEAEASCRHTLKMWPDHALAHRNLGRVLSARGRYGESADSYRRAAALDPDNASFLYYHGHSALLAERFEEAGQALERALTLAPDDRRIAHDLIVANIALGWLDAAAAAYRHMRAQTPGNRAPEAERLGREGRDALNRGHRETAAAAFRKAVSLDINNDALHDGLHRAMFPETPPPDSLSANERLFVDLFQIYNYWMIVSRRETVTLHWFGHDVQKTPGDMWVYQEIIWETRPDVIIETGTFRGGSAYCYASLFDLLGKGLVVTVDIHANKKRPQHKRVKYVTGSSTDAATVDIVRNMLPANSKIMVILDSDHSRDHVLAELRTWSSMVGKGCYLVVEDTTINFNPTLSSVYQNTEGPMEAIAAFLQESPEFIIDKSRERFMVTVCANGFLRRI